MIEGLGIKAPFPKLTFSELEPGQFIDFYEGQPTADEIRIWAQKQLTAGSSNKPQDFKAKPVVADPELAIKLKSAAIIVHTQEEFNEQLTLKNQDIVVFTFDSSVDSKF